MKQDVRVELQSPDEIGPRTDEFACLFTLTDRLYRATSLDDVYDAALDAIAETLGCHRASILVFDDAGAMRFVAWRGLSNAYRAAVDGHSPWTRGEGRAQPIFVEDITATDEPDWIKATIKAEGIVGLAFIPLVAQGGVMGKFMTYYETKHQFTQREIDIAVTIARQVGFSLERAGAEAARLAAEDALRQSEERFRLMLENAPVMIWMSDTQGRCVHLNKMLREFWGIEEAALPNFDWATTIHPDDAPGIFSAMEQALAVPTKVQTKGRFRTAAGMYRVLVTDAQPRYSAGGEFLGMIGVNSDITEREEAEADLRDSEERFRLAVEAAPSGMIISNSAGEITLVNVQAEKLFGYTRDELVGQSVDLLVPEAVRGDHPALRKAHGTRSKSRLAGEGRIFHARRKDGSEFPAEIGLSAIRTGAGTLALAAVVDISERKRADAQRDVLLAELNHRVKNTLAVVQGIAHQTFKGDEVAPKARAAFEGRVHALALAHNMLTQTTWSHAPLHRIVEDALGTRAENKGRVVSSGPVLLLDPKGALAIAMALHELLTNAIKYGALSNDSGTVSVSWGISGARPDWFTLEWREIGGPDVSPPEHQGFGSRLITRILASDLDGEVNLSFGAQGVVCTISAPWPVIPAGAL